MTRVLTGTRDPHLEGARLTVPVYGVLGDVVGEMELPELFYYPIRKDIINRAFLSTFTAMIQPKG
ncbi:MAG: hypothetical protein QW300_01240, partial [Desulfurococcaceae archaeon]